MPKPERMVTTLISLIFSSFQRHTPATRFPPDRSLKRACGSTFSACRLLPLLLAPLAQAASPVDTQIQQAVQQHLERQLKQEAARQGWQGMRFTHADSVLNSTVRLAPCASEPKVINIDADVEPLARQRLQVTCPGADGWAVTVNSQATVFVPALYSTTVIERDQVIGADDVRAQELNVAKAARGFYQRPQDVVGQTARRRIRANQPLSPGLVIGPVLIKRGQQVKIVASRDGIQAQTQGEALRDGRAGEVIKVRNLSSEKVIEAKVLEAGLVTSTF